MTQAATILPGSTIGVLGSGQLGRMFAIAARRMGYRVHAFSPDSDTPTGQVADLEITAPYEDLDAIRDFARQVDVITFEFENIPAASVDEAAAHVLVRPSGEVLHITQQRLREKLFLTRANLPVTPFAAIRSFEDLQSALSRLGTPAILKTAAFGYDGKGQVRIDHPDQGTAAWERLGGQESILESLVDFEREVSVIGARDPEGNFAHFGVIENRHRHHILDVSLAPAVIPQRLALEAVELTRAILEAMDVVGVLCVELFLTRDQKLLINELAPRPHNSGHLTIDACMSSQFEQQLRAVCGLPLGSTEMLRPAAMANLLGDLWAGGEPDWPAACAIPNVKLHLYGKLEPRPGRKMGHLTALAATPEAAEELVIRARDALR
jgi:5-(carboxyamino)imidazole ribonucleotide synthase